MAFRVADAGLAYMAALERGATSADTATSALPDAYAIEGIGGSLLYLVDRDPFAGLGGGAGLARGRREERSRPRSARSPHPQCPARADAGVVGFYRKLFGFEEQKYFDIKGKATGLFSQAMIAPDHAIRIPLNEARTITARSRNSCAITMARASSTSH